MGGNPHWRRRHVELTAIRERATIADRLRCGRIIEAWNKQRTHEWSPAMTTIERRRGHLELRSIRERATSRPSAITAAEVVPSR
jgi:hypothetical protein